ncbi:extensin-like domain-containing protein [Erythrobacter ani]|uniref:Extensin family protein n=1 Tax=Erythrobacter ani TaxID=2827235 RepID=A0ABS6SQC2_9SPHN|nr:extensin family protein [Erythrobacter ani]MBV7267215.1 extensin family protein [Erythrobacter ani]
MPSNPNKPSISRRIGRFTADRRVLSLMIVFAVLVAGWSWLGEHPEHNPWTPLDLRDPIGMATANKLLALKEDIELCRVTLDRSDVEFRALESTGDGACERPDRTQLESYPLSPDTPAVTCPVAAALELWRAKTVAPAARDILGSELGRIEHLGAYSCRRLYGREEGAWSEHATGNAIDISAFVLEDGTRISVFSDWDADDEQARFLREVRDGACGVFATVLSPDYNAAHSDHFHLDQESRWSGVCR